MNIFLITFTFLISSLSYAQIEYEPSATNPFGQQNPDAPAQLSDFAPMIGSCDCNSQKRIDKDNWADQEKVIWEFKYTLNGMAIQDQLFIPDGNHTGNIRQFITDSSKWFVTNYSVKPGPSVNSVISGNKSGDNIILTMDQKSPAGIEGKIKMTFYDISESGFKWIGEWITPDESITYSFLRIECTKTDS